MYYLTQSMVEFVVIKAKLSLYMTKYKRTLEFCDYKYMLLIINTHKGIQCQ